MTAPAMTRASAPPRPKPVFRWVATVLVAVVLVWAIVGLDVKWARLLDAPNDLYTIGKLMFSRMEWDDFGRLAGSMWESISIAWLGTVIAAIFAVPLAFLAAENLAGRGVAWVIRQIFNLLRAVPEVVLAIAFVPIFGLTPMTGVVAIGIGSIGTLGKLCAEVIEGISPSPIEAVDAVGASRIQRLRWGVLPQVVPEITSFVLYRFEINIRASAVLGVVGAGGIGTDLAQSIRFKDWGTAGLALIIVIATTILIDAISGWVRRRLVSGPSASRRDDARTSPAAHVVEPI